MWTETAASEKSRFRSTMLDEYVFYDIYSVKVIKLNTDYSYCRKLTVTVTPNIFINCNYNCNWKNQ